MTKQTIAIAATFTAEPVAETLHFWAQELGWDWQLEFAPYNQIFQQLLDPTSLLARHRQGVNVLLVRLADWAEQSWARSAHELCATLTTAARDAAPYLVCLCPASAALRANTRLQRVEAELAAELSQLERVYLTTAAELLTAYQIENYDDPYSDKLGRIPYTPEFYAALGTLLARKIHCLRSAPRKVLALDCDQTLWQGVCGEVGPQGVVLDAPRRAVQEFAVQQQAAGLLLCLCSKNNEEDVLATFAAHPDMPLRLEHLAARRLNWEAKSANLRALAAELDLGLDSFLLLDDDPVACAEVQANCPAVLTLQLPAQPEEIPHFLQHLWACDRLTITAEDRARTALYQQNAAREQARRTALSLGAFLAGLELQIHIAPAQPPQFARLAQLTQRTNQFNCATLRRSEAELQQLCQQGAECLAVEVSDRFGDYGLVGVMIVQTEADALAASDFLLSCRALGRGVEQRMLAELGRMAAARGLRKMRINWRASAKNRPARDFLMSVGGEQEGYFELAAEQAAALRYDPDAAPRAADEPPIAAEAAPNAPFSRQTAELTSAARILAAVGARRQRPRSSTKACIAPRTLTEQRLCELWRQVLGCERVGVTDDFFALGGHSLQATLLAARVRDAFGVELALAEFFAAPTITTLAALLEREQLAQASAADLTELLDELASLSEEEVKTLLAESAAAQ